MTGMLASVMNEAEAAAALAAGVDIIDMKNPWEGALGALPSTLITTIMSSLDGRVTTSATVGDLPPEPGILTEAIRTTAATGVGFVKVGFFSSQNLDPCISAIGRLTPAIAVIAVLFADLCPDPALIKGFAKAGFSGIMLDTMRKDGPSLLESTTPTQLREFVLECRHWGLLCGLAGSLKHRDIPRLLPLEPDYLGFRGALCSASQRGLDIDPERLSQVRQAIPREKKRSRPETAHIPPAGTAPEDPR